VGTSITTGQTNCVCWAGIHHKTSPHGGNFGWPDPTYFERVRAELSMRGVVLTP
jgi:deltex-like protein